MSIFGKEEERARARAASAARRPPPPNPLAADLAASRNEVARLRALIKTVDTYVAADVEAYAASVTAKAWREVADG